MKKRDSLTAAELAAQLANDPDYQSKLAAQNERAAAILAEVKPILADLEALGISVNSIDELRLAYSALPESVVKVLVRWMNRLSIPSLQESIVRELASVQEPFDVRPLLQLFERTTSDSLRWAIANTLAELRPLDARDWVINALGTSKYGRAREMLLLALARIAPSSVANPVLVTYLEEMPGHVALGLAESGGRLEAELLERQARTEHGWVLQELTRAISMIGTRLNAG